MVHQQHLGQVRVEHPDLDGQRVVRRGTGCGQPATRVVELDPGETHVHRRRGD
jgi:hypothetical protein